MTKVMLSKAFIVVRSGRGKRHMTPIGSERLGLTLCGKRTDGWAIDGSGPPTCMRCLAKSWS